MFETFIEHVQMKGHAQMIASLNRSFLGGGVAGVEKQIMQCPLDEDPPFLFSGVHSNVKT